MHRHPTEHLPLVLLVDGSATWRPYLTESLVADRFRVHPVADADEARRALRTVPVEVAIIDADLPGAAGLELLGFIRSASADAPWHAGMPIMSLGRSGHPHEVVRAIEQGADDHLTRPFHYAELVARLRGLVRRTRGGALNDQLRVGPLVVDRRARCARVNGRPLELSAKEFALLDALARDPHRVLTKQELLRDVWGYISTGRTRTVDSHASRLRRKLEVCGAGQRFVANVWGVGYRLLPEGA